MFVGRKSELKKLNEAFIKDGLPVVILYGREGIGKTTLVREFVKEKDFVYYLGRELSKKEQLLYFEPIPRQVDLKVAEGRKVCLVIDEFDVMQKAYKDFYEELETEISRPSWQGHVMILLVSSSVQWIENQMVEDMGSFSSYIDSFIKLREFTFLEMVSRFPDSSTEECITIYSILGGVPGYLDHWNTSDSIRDNIIRLFLKQDGALRKEAFRFLKTSLRELPLYNTILSVLAEDEPKLNYLYNRTGFSRAKISVYIKNLIQIDVAEKYFSYEPKKKDRAMKGLYGISDRFLHFWYKFVFPNLPELEFGEAESFYESYIRNELFGFVEQTFGQVCREFLILMNRYNKLPAAFQNPQIFYGKEGMIPLVAEGEKGELLVGTCKWSTEPMDGREFEKLLKLTEQTGQEADYYYLFSREGFTNEFLQSARGMDQIELVDLDRL